MHCKQFLFNDQIYKLHNLIYKFSVKFKVFYFNFFNFLFHEIWLVNLKTLLGYTFKRRDSATDYRIFRASNITDNIGYSKYSNTCS